ncbi:hypothetical protein Emag_007297 [Eimeria magna]
MTQLPDNVPPKVVRGGRNIPLPPAVEHLSLKDAQAQDPECQEFLCLARTPRAAWPPHLRHTPLQFCVLHDLVYVRIGDALPRVVLPAIFRSRAIQAHHLSYCGCHFGVFKIAARLACRYWWPHMQRDVRAYFRRRPFCIANTDAPRKWKWLDLPIGAPFELIAIDLFGPLPITRRGNNHILVTIDHYTRWVELVHLPNPTAAQVAQALFNEWISRWGVPRALLSDNGPQFTAELLRQLCTTFGISKLFASPYNPRGTTAELVDPVSGTKLLANRARLKFLDAPQPSGATLAPRPSHQLCAPYPVFPVLRSSPLRARTSCHQLLLLNGGGRGLAASQPHGSPARADSRIAPSSAGGETHVVEIEPPHSAASQQTVQQSSPAGAPPAPTPSTPVARKRQRAEPAEPRIVKFVDIKNAKKKLAKPQTQEALQHKESIYLHRRLKAYRGARKEVWKVAKGLLRLPVERGWTPPPESLVAKMKGQVEDSPAVEEIWDEWPSPFAKLERQWDDIYLAEFPDVTAAPRWGTPSWASFLTAFSRQFIARPSARVSKIRGWKDIQEYEPEIQPDPNPVRIISAALQALDGLLAPRARHDEEDSDEVVEARPALPTPASSEVSAELEGSAELSPLPAPKAPGSSRAAPQTAPSSPAAPLPGKHAGQGPPSPLSPVTEGTVSALSQIASEGWDLMTTRCVWWTLTAAREYRTAKQNFEHRMQESLWVDNMSRTVTGARTMLANFPQGQSSVAGLVGRLRQEQQRGVTATEDQVERLVGFWLSSAERLASLMGPGRTFLLEFLNGLYRAGQALLGATVAAAASSVPVADPAAPREPATPVRSIKVDHPSAVSTPPGETTPPPPLPDLSTEEFRLPEPAVATRNSPLQLGMDGLLNGSAGRSPQATRAHQQLARNRDPQPSSRKHSNPLPNAFVPRGGDVIQLR